MSTREIGLLNVKLKVIVFLIALYCIIAMDLMELKSKSECCRILSVLQKSEIRQILEDLFSLDSSASFVLVRFDV